MIRSLLFCFVLLPLFVGCSTVSIAEQITPPPEFSARIQPVRTLRILVMYDETADSAEIASALGEASSVLSKQIGVELVIASSPVLVNWGGGRMTFEKLQSRAREHGVPFDIAIGFASELPWRWVNNTLQPQPENTLALNQNMHRRFIVSKTTHSWIIAHEIAHSFIFCHEHSAAGLMRANTKLAMIMSGADYALTTKDIEEALRNKWRKFGGPVSVAVLGGPKPKGC